jgi:hypothetical protein
MTIPSTVNKYAIGDIENEKKICFKCVNIADDANVSITWILVLLQGMLRCNLTALTRNKKAVSFMQ